MLTIQQSFLTVTNAIIGVWSETAILLVNWSWKNTTWKVSYSFFTNQLLRTCSFNECYHSFVVSSVIKYLCSIFSCFRSCAPSVTSVIPYQRTQAHPVTPAAWLMCLNVKTLNVKMLERKAVKLKAVMKSMYGCKSEYFQSNIKTN